MKKPMWYQKLEVWDIVITLIIIGATFFVLVIQTRLLGRQAHIMETQTEILKKQIGQSELYFNYTQKKDSAQEKWSKEVDSLRGIQNESLKVFSERQSKAAELSANSFSKSVETSERSLDALRAKIVLQDVNINDHVPFTFKIDSTFETGTKNFVTKFATTHGGMELVFRLYNNGTYPAKNLSVNTCIGASFSTSENNFVICKPSHTFGLHDQITSRCKENAATIDYINGGDSAEVTIHIYNLIDTLELKKLRQTWIQEIKTEAIGESPQGQLPNQIFTTEPIFLYGNIKYNASGSCLRINFVREIDLGKVERPTRIYKNGVANYFYQSAVSSGYPIITESENEFSPDFSNATFKKMNDDPLRYSDRTWKENCPDGHETQTLNK